MSQLRISAILFLLFWLGCAFLGQLGSSVDPNHVAIRPFVFLLLAASVLLTISVPAFRRASRLLLIGLTLGVYVVGRMVFYQSAPIVGGLETYFSLFQGALLVLGVLLAQRLTRSVDEAERTAGLLTLDGNSGRVKPLNRAHEEIERAMVVARRYHRPLSLLLIEIDFPQWERDRSPADTTVALNLALANLVQHLDGSLRRSELILTSPFRRRIALLLSDTTERGAFGLSAHVRALAQDASLELTMATAVFPDDGLTFAELLDRAERDLGVRERPLVHVNEPASDRRAEAG
jgi:hypothetical protein